MAITLQSSLTVNTYRNNVQLLFFNMVESNVEPFPTFDLEINKEDKDGDIENPEIKKNPPSKEEKEEK